MTLSACETSENACYHLTVVATDLVFSIGLDLKVEMESPSSSSLGSWSAC